MIVALNPGVPAARADRPFMGAYVHLPSWFQQNMDDAARHRAIIDNRDRFEQSGRNVLIPYPGSEAKLDIVGQAKLEAAYPADRFPSGSREYKKAFCPGDRAQVDVDYGLRRGAGTHFF